MPTTYDVGGFPRAVVAARFDNDAQTDVAVAVNGRGLVVLLNRGGRFVEGPLTTLPQDALWLFSADVNADGRMDLVSVGQSRIATLFNRGDGTFDARTTAIDPEKLYLSYPLAFADFNGDGQRDLALGFTRSNTRSDIRVYFGAADGTFAQTVAATEIASRVRSLVAFDFTNDGRTDVVYADGNATLVLPGNGDGTFQSAQLVAHTSSFLAAADVDADGREDLFIGTVLLRSADNFSVWHAPLGVSPGTFADVDDDGNTDMLLGALVFRGSGNGQFETVGGGPVVGIVHAVADFDGDGIRDVVSATPTGVAMRHGRGGALLDGGGSSAFGGAQTHTILTADLNGDGRADLVTISLYDMGIHLSGAGGVFQQVHTYNFQQVTRSAALGDFDHDGELDVFLGSAGLARGAGDGSFAPPEPVEGFRSEDDFESGDVNGDGNLDIVSADYVRLLGDGHGHFTVQASSVPVPDKAGAVAVADFNRDGKDDVVAASLNGALQYFDSAAPGTAAAVLTEGVGRIGVAAADVDGDGNPDALALTPATNELLIFGGNGNGTFRAPQRLPVQSGEEYSHVAVADVTEDGRADLLVTRAGSGWAVVYAQNADGTFTESSRVPSGSWFGSAAADFDHDGHLDLALLMSQAAGEVHTHLSVCGGESPAPSRRRSVRH